MFPQLRERIGSALDLVVEFSTLGEYRLGADGALHRASALMPALRTRPASPAAQRAASGREPQLGGAGAVDAARAAVRRTVAGGAAGRAPVATPAARRRSAPPTAAPCRGERLHRSAAARGARRPKRLEPPAPEHLCLAV
jgi:hypothetical protein